MTESKQIYKCLVCGNVVEVLHTGAGELVCCGQPMALMAPKAAEEGNEKHLPVVAELPANVCRGKDGVKIKVGEQAHPMTEEHHIEWIELITETQVLRKYLKPGEKPVAMFMTDAKEVIAREYCNMHGHWKSE